MSTTPSLAIREIQEQDVEPLVQYWFDATPTFLEGMGVDLSKMPTREEWKQMLFAQIHKPLEEKNSYCLIWLADGIPVGHSNANKILFGEEAYMHLHLWKPDLRQKGIGSSFIQLTLLHFFQKLQLKRLYCEPYALNPAPNRTLEKAGFRLVKEYVTTPGWINSEQPVKRWKMTFTQFQEGLHTH
ncbi:GNAT family N-acetyltransferase [Rufibacter tibetensis]|uniref:N-acetyltransferase domain-containing protein n=1 Tax=Rufibacter tibetensis TaxID=512763 RepID=A0A0P0CKP7_9BACT|nr:GNAT family protein [Rufibacter tibetensis]ALJ00117.1 hypothetical protein DC20_15500 [Rufibacter tibetensis]